MVPGAPSSSSTSTASSRASCVEASSSSSSSSGTLWSPSGRLRSRRSALASNRTGSGNRRSAAAIRRGRRDARTRDRRAARGCAPSPGSSSVEPVPYPSGCRPTPERLPSKYRSDRESLSPERRLADPVLAKFRSGITMPSGSLSVPPLPAGRDPSCRRSRGTPQARRMPCFTSWRRDGQRSLHRRKGHHWT